MSLPLLYLQGAVMVSRFFSDPDTYLI